MGKTIFLRFLNVIKENFNNFHPKKTYIIHGFQFCTKVSLHI